MADGSGSSSEQPDAGSAQPKPLLGEAHFRLLVDSVRDYAIFLLDANGNVASWNLGAERIKGYAPGEIIGRPFTQFFEEADRIAGRPQRLLDGAVAHGAVTDEGWRVRKDGTRLWVSSVITALFDDRGTHIGYGKVTRDETDRHAASVALAASEERFRLLVGSLKEHALYLLDTDGRVVTWNQGAERIKGYRSDDIIGHHFSEFFTADDRASEKPKRELELATRLGSFEEEGWRVRKDGSRFWAQVVVTALHDASGHLRGFGKVTRDDTRRHEAAIELQQAVDRAVTAEATARTHAAELEQRVSERTQLLSEQSAALSRSNEELEKFAYVAAHDLQEPLRMIVSYVGLLERRYGEIFNDQARGFMKVVSESAVRMREMIAGVLQFSRAEADNAKIEVCDLAACADEAVALLADMIAASGAVVEIGRMPRLRCSRPQMARVFQNLIANGIKFRGNATPVVRVTAAVGVSDWTISVSDNGIGIPPEHQQRIFGIFERLHSSSQFPGSGIGLATCQKIIQAHGGRLWVESAEGRGATFAFTLSHR